MNYLGLLFCVFTANQSSCRKDSSESHSCHRRIVPVSGSAGPLGASGGLVVSLVEPLELEGRWCWRIGGLVELRWSRWCWEVGGAAILLNSVSSAGEKLLSRLYRLGY